MSSESVTECLSWHTPFYIYKFTLAHYPLCVHLWASDVGALTYDMWRRNNHCRGVIYGSTRIVQLCFQRLCHTQMATQSLQWGMATGPLTLSHSVSVLGGSRYC